jgi:hypothetical protein
MAAGAGRYSLDLSVYDGNVSEITISGSITDTPGAAQSGISATFSESGGATGTSYSQSTCTLTLNAAQPTPVASGRIWATLDCPAITNVVNDATCDATATFLFENCIE